MKIVTRKKKLTIEDVYFKIQLKLITRHLMNLVKANHLFVSINLNFVVITLF
jgi:hypothetical protein